MVVGHTDWGVQNCRFVGDTLRVVYDWDSLARDRETTIVAQAAANYPFNWALAQPPAGPSAEEARAFIADYEAARGARFTATEWAEMAAAATYALAYAARLEHSLQPQTTAFAPGGGRARLAPLRRRLPVLTPVGHLFETRPSGEACAHQLVLGSSMVNDQRDNPPGWADGWPLCLCADRGLEGGKQAPHR